MTNKSSCKSIDQATESATTSNARVPKRLLVQDDLDHPMQRFVNQLRSGIVPREPALSAPGRHKSQITGFDGIKVAVQENREGQVKL